jgi:mycothiol maleylpyruvate isomerase-like protein
VDTSDLRAAAASCSAYLGSATTADWTTPVPGLEWTVGQTVAHISTTLLWYATDFTAGPAELSLFPEAPTDEDPWATLLWANGRTALGELPRRDTWKWRCTPLDG